MMQQNGTNKANCEARKKWQQEWSRMMIDIWQEKITRLKVIDTGRLWNEISQHSVISEDSSTITHQFMEYGIYQDAGTGNGYTHDNGGNLEFLEQGRVSRYPHRKPRKWYSKSYYASVMALKEKMSEMYAEEFCGIIVRGLR